MSTTKTLYVCVANMFVQLTYWALVAHTWAWPSPSRKNSSTSGLVGFSLVRACAPENHFRKEDSLWRSGFHEPQ